MTNKTQAQYLDLVTPGMLRAAQLRSELGAYAASKLSGAYDLITELYGVMHAAADPVPPAGAEPEVLHWQVAVEGYKSVQCETAERAEDTLNHYADRGRAVRLVELVDRAHVTRLQAEVERLKAACAKEFESVETLSHELTKARELMRRVTAYGREHFDLNDADAAAMEIRNYLSNQSAPADKGQGKMVDVEAAMLLAFSDHAKQFTFKNHSATPGMFPVGFPWFKAGYEAGRGEQPAPVAVVLPKRIKHRAENPAGRISYIKGWNACLDEFARLNSEPKP